MCKTNFALGGFRTQDCFVRDKRLTARPQGLHDRDRTTPRLMINYFESIFLYKATRQKPSGILA